MRNYTKKELINEGFIIYHLLGKIYLCILHDANKEEVFTTISRSLVTIRKRATRFLCGEYLYI